MNGDDWGVMDMEHFTTEMLEKTALKHHLFLDFRTINISWHVFSGSQSQPETDEYWLSNPRIFVELLGKNSKKTSGAAPVTTSYVRSRLKERDYFPVLFDRMG